MMPLQKVRRLGDFGGRWSLSLRCRCCRHMAELPARKLIERHGPQKLLKELAARLYCRPCQEKYCHCRGRNFEAMVDLRGAQATTQAMTRDAIATPGQHQKRRTSPR